MAKQSMFSTELYGYDPEERRRRKLESYDRLLAAQQTPQSRLGFALGNLFGEYLAPETGEEGKISSINRALKTAANQFPDQSSPEYYEAVAAAIPEQYADSKIIAQRKAVEARAVLEKAMMERSKLALELPESITPRLQQLAARIQANPNDASALAEYNSLAMAGQQGAAKIAREEAKASGSASEQQKGRFVELSVKRDLQGLTPPEQAELKAITERLTIAGPKAPPQEKAVLSGKANLLGEVEKGAIQSAKTTQTADAIDRVLASSFVGFGSDAKLKISQVAQAFGVEVTGTSETEQLKQLLAQLAQGQAKSLPGTLSEKELTFLRETIGTPGFTLGTLRSVVDRLRVDARASEIENDKVQKYISDEKDLNKYDFAKAKRESLEQARKEIQERNEKRRRYEELLKKEQGR